LILTIFDYNYKFRWENLQYRIFTKFCHSFDSILSDRKGNDFLSKKGFFTQRVEWFKYL